MLIMNSNALDLVTRRLGWITCCCIDITVYLKNVLFLFEHYYAFMKYLSDLIMMSTILVFFIFL